jgi:AcrR family transcriptional regulator
MRDGACGLTGRRTRGASVQRRWRLRPDASHHGTVVDVSTDPRTLTRHGQDRKAELLRHAETLFIERGYADTRMIDIAQAAGVAKGLVYWYFENKDALFREIVLDMRRRLRRAQAEAIDGIDDPLERLYVGTVVSVRFIAEHHRLYGLITSLLGGDRRLRETQSQSRRVLADDAAALLAEGQDRGVVRLDDDPVALAHANAGVVSHFVLLYSDGLYSEGAPGVTIDAAAHGAARYVIRAVAVDEPTADAVIAAHGVGAAAVPLTRRAG